MTHRTNEMAIENEARIQEAIAAVKRKKYTVYAAANAFNIPKRTLYDRINKSVQPCNLAHESDQNLSHAEIKERYDGLHVSQFLATPHVTKHCEKWLKKSENDALKTSTVMQ